MVSHLKFLILTSLNLPQGETCGLHLKEIQHVTSILLLHPPPFPSLGGVRGGRG